MSPEVVEFLRDVAKDLAKGAIVGVISTAVTCAYSQNLGIMSIFGDPPKA
jgi:hypothetical protein